MQALGAGGRIAGAGPAVKGSGTLLSMVSVKVRTRVGVTIRVRVRVRAYCPYISPIITHVGAVKKGCEKVSFKDESIING